MKAILKTASVALIAVVFVSTAALAQGTLFVNNDKVGIGVATPLHDLHVVNTAGSGKDTVAHFVNNGAPEVHFTDTTLAVTWQLSPLSSGAFSMTKKGTGGAEFQINQDGTVLMGPGAATTFNLTPGGNLTILGTLTQGSSRSIKEGLEPLDSRQVLARVADLELLEWSYLGQADRHFGPMAEDFHAAFGFGPTDKGLAPGDVAGVALKALQGLNEVVAEKNQQIDQLSRELAELRQMVESLASR